MIGEDIHIRFGKHKGKPLKEIPDEYLKWCIKKDALRGRALFYAKCKTNHPLDKWEVTVTDSVGQDGRYLVEAYNRIHATRVCQKKFKIQNTQSFCGTSYRAKQLER